MRRAAAIVSASEELAAGRAEFGALAQRVEALEARVRELASDQARRGPFDSVDVRLIVAIASATVEMPCFFAADVLTLADTAPALDEALALADIGDAGALAWWCRRVADCPLEGLTLRRHGRRVGRGRPWKIHRAARRHCDTAPAD